MATSPPLSICVQCHQAKPNCYHTKFGAECPGCYEARIAREARETSRRQEPLGATGHCRGIAEGEAAPDTDRIRIVKKW